MSSLYFLGLSPSIIEKLVKADIVHDEEIVKMKPTELSSVTNLSLKESSEVIRLFTSKSSSENFQTSNLKQILEKEEDTTHVVTFCKSLDELLGGGIPIGIITEISGTPGIGKTQMCLQTCVSVQVPEEYGGVEGEAIYIDTEGSFAVSRLKEMASWAEKHIERLRSVEHHQDFNVEKILKGIYYFRCNTYLELIAVIKNLNSFLCEHNRVRLIVIDSIAFHFRHDFPNVMTRTGILCSLAQDLIQQATKHKLAVIVTNQMTTKVDTGGSHLVPSLGETWGHCPTIRLYLFWSGLMRSAKIVKAPHIPNNTIHFQITSGGIRDRQSTENNKSNLSSDFKKRKYDNS